MSFRRYLLLIAVPAIALQLAVNGQAFAANPANAELHWRTIEATTGLLFERKNVTLRASGCVVGIHSHGFDVLTAYHCVSDTTRLHIELYSRPSYPAPFRTFHDVRLLAILPGQDLALLRVFSDEFPHRILTLAQSAPQDGANLIAVGCGNQYAPYAVTGAFRSSGRFQGNTRCISSTCAIIGGFSGGPIVDDRGELVGLNVAISTDGGALSVPSEQLREFLRSHRCYFFDGDRIDPSEINDREFAIILGWIVLESLFVVARFV